MYGNHRRTNVPLLPHQSSNTAPVHYPSSSSSSSSSTFFHRWNRINKYGKMIILGVTILLGLYAMTLFMLRDSPSSSSPPPTTSTLSTTLSPTSTTFSTDVASLLTELRQKVEQQAVIISNQRQQLQEQQQTTSVAPPTTTKKMKFMHILIPTVSREALPPNVDYLTPTIEHLLDQLSTREGDSLSVPHQVQIWLLNHNVPRMVHKSFEALKQEYGSVKTNGGGGEPLINFVSSNPSQRTIQDKQARIYQQTVDFLWSIKYLREQNERYPARYTLFMEDDFTLCKNAMLAMEYFIRKASDYYPDWVSLRVSYGLNGVIVKTSELDNIINYYESALKRYGPGLPHPPDHMIYYYAREQLAADSKRKLVAYRSNLFSHIGDISSFTGRAARYNPNCHQVLYDWLQDGERFRNEDCPLDDISPCTPPDDKVKQRWSSLIGFNMDIDKLLVSNPEHFPLCPSKSRAAQMQEASQLKCRVHASN